MSWYNPDGTTPGTPSAVSPSQMAAAVPPGGGGAPAAAPQAGAAAGADPNQQSLWQRIMAMLGNPSNTTLGNMASQFMQQGAPRQLPMSAGGGRPMPPVMPPSLLAQMSPQAGAAGAQANPMAQANQMFNAGAAQPGQPGQQNPLSPAGGANDPLQAFMAFQKLMQPASSGGGT